MKQLFRELTQDELSYVSGGEGQYYGSDTYYHGEGVFSGWGGGDGYGYNTGGGWSTTQPNAVPLANAPSPDDRHIDCVAQHLKDAIDQKPNAHSHEWVGAIVVGPNGTVHAAPNILDNGVSGGATTSAHSWEDFGIQTYETVIGFVHNHPDTTEAGNPNAYDTPGASYDDMKGLEDYHAGFGNNGGWPFDPDDVRIYVDYKGQMREYDWKDQDRSGGGMAGLTGNANGSAPWAKTSNYQPACNP